VVVNFTKTNHLKNTLGQFLSWFRWFMVLNATFNNISAISWRSVLLREETGVPWENHRPAASHWQNLSHSIEYTLPEQGSNSTLVVISTDCIGSYK